MASFSFAIPQLLHTYPTYPTATLLPGLTVWFLGRVLQGSTLSVQSVSILPPSPSQLHSGPPATVPRLTPFSMLLSGVSFTPRHVLLNLSPFDSICLSTLSAPLPYLTSKSLSDTQSLLNVLFESKVVHFQ